MSNQTLIASILILSLAVWAWFWFAGLTLRPEETAVVVGICSVALIAARWLYRRSRKPKSPHPDATNG